MLAFAPKSSPDYTHAPAFPSPLRPRSANIYGPLRHSNYTYMNINDETSTKDTSAPQCNSNNNGNNNTKPIFGSDVPRTTTATTTKLPFSQRQIKRNPLQQNSSTLHTSRRSAYLRKVSNQRDETRFERRGEDMMRLDYIQRQKAWEAERAREAAFVPSDFVEEEDDEQEVTTYDLPESSHMDLQQSSMPEAEVEEFLRDEGKELEALLEYLPSAGDDMMYEDEQDFDESSLWSDDADYDALFSEVLSQQEQQQQQGGNAAESSQAMLDMGSHGEDEMDMS
ncbi:hypothetical protein Slin14017_G093080 [Septoria linicola]|nr:hypothetical protein Slin14017_G093080 [Septoria linicola]